MNELTVLSRSNVFQNFLSLPRELRNSIYAYVLVDGEYIDLSTWIHHPLSPQLLRTNKMIHNEAAEVLYTYNRFNFTTYDADRLLVSFLDQIGPNNSKHIRHIRIGLPTFQSLNLDEVALTDESIRILGKLKDCYGNLRTLTMSQSSVNIMEHRLDELEHPNVVNQALELVNAHFRAISFLREAPSSDHDSGYAGLSIIVELNKESVNNDIRRKMRSHGWILELLEEVVEEEEEEEEEEYDPSFDGTDYNGSDWGGEDSDDYNNDYDINNDSDFWRRAGD